MEALYSPKSKLRPFTPSVAEQDGKPLHDVTAPPSRDAKRAEAESAEKGGKSTKITARIDCPVEGGTEKTDSAKTSKPKTPESGRESVADSGVGSVRPGEPIESGRAALMVPKLCTLSG